MCEIAASEFGGSTAVGMLRMRENQLFRKDFRIAEFISVLGEIFSA